jgi:hypothetical protein
VIDTLQQLHDSASLLVQGHHVVELIANLHTNEAVLTISGKMQVYGTANVTNLKAVHAMQRKRCLQLPGPWLANVLANWMPRCVPSMVSARRHDPPV